MIHAFASGDVGLVTVQGINTQPSVPVQLVCPPSRPRAMHIAVLSAEQLSLPHGHGSTRRVVAALEACPWYRIYLQLAVPLPAREFPEQRHTHRATECTSRPPGRYQANRPQSQPRHRSAPLRVSTNACWAGILSRASLKTHVVEATEITAHVQPRRSVCPIGTTLSNITRVLTGTH